MFEKVKDNDLIFIKDAVFYYYNTYRKYSNDYDIYCPPEVEEGINKFSTRAEVLIRAINNELAARNFPVFTKEVNNDQ